MSILVVFNTFGAFYVLMGIGVGLFYLCSTSQYFTSYSRLDRRDFGRFTSEIIVTTEQHIFTVVIPDVVSGSGKSGIRRFFLNLAEFGFGQILAGFAGLGRYQCTYSMFS